MNILSPEFDRCWFNAANRAIQIGRGKRKMVWHWIPGKDGKKGSDEGKYKKIPPYSGSDDAISWK